MQPVFLKKSDVLPTITSLVSGDGGPVDLTTVTGVYFVFKPKFTGVATIVSGTVTNALAGQVSYSWTTGVTSSLGPYYAEWRLMFSGNSQRTFPQDNYINFEIVSGLY